MSIFRWQSRDVKRDELDEELGAHLTMAVRDRVGRGEDPAAAERAARRELGNVQGIRATTEDTWGGQWWEHTRQDLRYGLRGLARNPGFTITVVLTFALGVGANAAVFSLIEPLMLRTPPGLVESARLHRIYNAQGSAVASNFSGADFSALKAALAGQATVAPRLTSDSATLTSGGVELAVRREITTAAYLSILTGPAALGRYFTVEEGDARAPLPRAVLSHALWMGAFGGDRAVLGRDVTVGSTSYTVVGVATRGFRGLDVSPVDVWTTAVHFARMPEPWYLWDNKKFGTIVARVEEGAEPRSVAARATIAWRRVNGDSPTDSTRRILLGSIVEGRGPVASRELKITGRVAGVALIVLLVACANIATLSLLRAARRRREIAVRVALGVSRARLVRQFLAETLMLAGWGGMASILLAWWAGTALRTVLMPEVQFPAGVLGVRVLLAVGVLSVIAGLLSGLAPALQASRPDLTNSLKEGRRSGLTGTRLRTGLLIGQSALSVVLIVGAGLFARSLAKLNEIDLGIDPARTITVALRPTVRSERELTDVMAAVAGRARQVPGVEHLSLATAGPFSYWNTRDVFLPGSDTSISLNGEQPGFAGVDSAFFSALALRPIEGRVLLATDRRGAPPVMVVSQTLARTVWPGRSAVGQCLIPFARTETCFSVVGVVPDVKQWSPVETPRMRFFMSIDQVPQPHPPATIIFVRAAPENIDAVASYIRTTVREVMPTARIMWPIVPLARNLEPEYRPWRVGTGLFVALGALALIVATIGIYSVIAYTLSQRTHEMGIRIALGARATDVHRLVLREGLRVVAIGAAIGIGLALASGQVIASLLYGVSSRDPLTLVASVVLLLGAGALAGVIPAWRASRVDPVVALRSD